MSSIWTNLFNSLSSAVTSATSAITPTELSSIFSTVMGSHFATIQADIQTLSGLGPLADPTQLTALMNKVTTDAVQTSGTPQSIFGLMTAMRGLVGKTDPTTLIEWGQLCQQMLTAISSTSTTIFGTTTTSTTPAA